VNPAVSRYRAEDYLAEKQPRILRLLASLVAQDDSFKILLILCASVPLVIWV
jgi:hypothetical protein